MTRQSLVLLGDSILDNAPYTRPAPDSTAHLQRLLPGWDVQRLARDGATMGDIRFQLTQLAPDSTVILSVGGNDVAAHVGLLDRRETNSGDVFGQLLQIADDFERQYEAVAQSVASRAKRTVLCTIYEVQLEPPVFAKLARVPLAVLNDRIIRTGSRLGLDVLDLRTVCAERDDFTLQIEPSGQGAEKIARAIARLVGGEPGLKSSRVFAA